MSFDVEGDAYGQFMGRFSEPLAARFVHLVDDVPATTAVDVGCGPGALTARLVDRLGVAAVSVIDPSESFVDAVRSRFPGIDAQQGVAEHLPYDDDRFDLATAQLVVHFMTDPVAALAEMARVVRPGGAVAAAVWDHAGDRGPLANFWQAARILDPAVVDESALPGTREGHLVELFDEAGLHDATAGSITVHLEVGSFEEWWHPFTFGIGPVGSYVVGLDPEARERLKTTYAGFFPEPPFGVDATAWTAVARV
jgi:ubiquinone/menaquinone biosynthesis C-methylase UbiE